MNKLLSLVGVLLALVVTIPQPVEAQTALKGFSGTSSSVTLAKTTGTVNWFISSANSVNPAPPVVRFLSATGVNATNKITVYAVTNSYAVTTNLWPTLTNISSFADASLVPAGTTLIVRHKATDTYEENQVGGSACTSTNITLQVALQNNTAAGDIVYACTPVGTIPVGNATITYYGGGLLYGQSGLPLLLEFWNSNTAAGFNVVSGDYLP